jgi:hypothetical protein
MEISDKQIAMEPIGADPVWDGGGVESNVSESNVPEERSIRDKVFNLFSNSEFGQVVETFLTTLAVFGVFLIQGIVLARILGPAGRGEFGTAMFFPRDVFLYAGLFGGIEIVNSYAVKGLVNVRSLKYSAAKVGLISGLFTGVIAAIVSVIVLVSVGKTYLIPFALLCCAFVPWEHMQLTISAVDRGTKNYRFYNVNRLLYAMTFVILLAVVYGLNIDNLLGLSPLLMICCLFVTARIVGILPTLRGMDVIGKLLGREKVQHEISGSEIRGVVDASLDQAEVPSAWTLLKNGRFYALSMLASELFERLDMFLIVAIASVTESGYYFVAVPAAQLLIVAPNALGVFTFNAGADKDHKLSVKQAIGVMSATALLQIVSALILSLIIPFLIVQFFKQPFAPAIPFALWLLPACAIKGYLQAVDGYLKGRDKPMIGVWARFLSIFVMLAFVAGVYSEIIPGPSQKLLSIPMAACLGQAISMIIISAAVVRDVDERQKIDQSLDSSNHLDGEGENVID